MELLRNPKEGCGQHLRKFLGGEEEVMESSKQVLFSASAGVSVRY